MMRKSTGFYPMLAVLAVTLALVGCSHSRSHASTTTTQEPAAAPAKPATSEKPAEPVKPTEKKEERPATAEKAAPARAAAKREAITPENNPTTKGGRGAPDLDKPQSPAAWIYIDGKSGKFKEEGGQPLLQWFIDDAASATPTFRVEAYEPLLGTPKDFKAVLRTIESEDGSDLVYGIAANEGTLEVGKEYSLLNPGSNFVIRNGVTGDVVKEIAPLPSGKYAIAAGITNTTTGKQTLAVTYFTVKSDE